MPKTTAERNLARARGARRSAMVHLMTARKNRSVINRLWDVKAPMWVKKKPGSKDRAMKLIGTHAMKIAAAGSVGYVGKVLGNEANQLRLPTMLTAKNDKGEPKKLSPWVPSVSKGATRMIEQFIAAYVQQAAKHAVVVREASAKKQLTGEMMRLGFEAVDSQVFGASMPVPRALIVLDEPKKAKKRASKEAEAEA